MVPVERLSSEAVAVKQGTVTRRGKVSRVMAKPTPVVPTAAEGNTRRHRGDFISPETRSRVMARIRGRDTGPERAIASGLQALGLLFESQARDLPGRPDFVMRELRIAVFVDGDFWHGWRFPNWRDKLSPTWEAKIAATKLRDTRNFQRLRRVGWTVIRIWEHQIKRDLPACIGRIALCWNRLAEAGITRQSAAGR